MVSAMHGPANCEVIPSFLSSKAAVAAVVGAGQWARRVLYWPVERDVVVVAWPPKAAAPSQPRPRWARMIDRPGGPARPSVRPRFSAEPATAVSV